VKRFHNANIVFSFRYIAISLNICIISLNIVALVLTVGEITYKQIKIYCSAGRKTDIASLQLCLFKDLCKFFHNEQFATRK